MDSQYLQKKKVPGTPGVYFFLGKNKKILYIGKATSLKDRLKSYFSKDLRESRSELIEKMVESAKTIEWKSTDSVLEALLLEADLIRKFKPAYNTKEKDDKSFNCIVITKEDFPKLLIVRKKDLINKGNEYKNIFGPYTSGTSLKDALKIIRKIIPYRDNKCELYEDQMRKRCFAKPCFNRQIGLCPGTCTGEISKKDYSKQIKRLELLLSGKISKLISVLKKEMDLEAKKQNFESANKIKKILYALTHIQDIALIKKDFKETGDKEFKIESYDIAHLAGKSTVGVFVVFKNGAADKNSYRKFNIKSAVASDDIGALKEMFTRRLNHGEWPLPSLFVIDGGTNQLNAIRLILKEKGINLPAVSVVKDDAHKAREILGDKEFALKYKTEIIASNAEAHRFVIGFHRKKFRRNFLA